MINRKLSSPILRALVLALAVASPSVSHAQTQVPPAGFAAPATAPVAPVPTTTTALKHTAPYTVVKGDSLTSIARKFNTTRKKLRDLNEFPASFTTVKPGDIIQVPAATISKTAAAKAKAKAYAMAQPVQDFDVPASTFASCPVPLPTPGDDATPAAATDSTEDSGKPAPIAKLVSPAEMAADPGPEVEIITPTSPRPESRSESTIPTPTVTMALKPLPPLADATATAATEPVPSGLIQNNSAKSNSTYSSRPSTIFSTGANTASVRPVPSPTPAPRLTNHGFNANPTANLSSNSGTASSASGGDWGARFFQQARMLGNQGIEYDDDWRPPGEAKSWVSL